MARTNPTGGAPIANRNATRHGLRAGQLPKGAAYIKRECDTLRRELEYAILDRLGEIDLYHAAVIQTAMRWERHGLLAQRWLRMEAANMTADQRLAYSRDIARASENRDRCLKELGLNVDRRQSAIDALYSDEPENPAHSGPSSPSDAMQDKRGENNTRGRTQRPRREGERR